MNKRVLHILFCTLLLVLSTAVIGFADSNDNTSILFTKDNYQMSADEPLSVYVTEESANVDNWLIEDCSIAYISSSNTRSATIIGLKGGSTTLTAIDSQGINYTCSIAVKVPEIELTFSEYTMGLNSKGYLSVKSGESVKWESSNEDIVSLEATDYPYRQYDSYGSYSTIALVGKGLGKATITATSDFGETATCIVTVKESYLELSDYEVSFYDWEPSTSDLESHGSSYIKIISGVVESVSSSNNEVATAHIQCSSNQELGYIYIIAVSRGTAEITVNGMDGSAAVIKVNVDYSFKFNKDELIIDCTYDQYWKRPGHFFSYNIGEPWETEYDLIAGWEITNVVSEDPNIVSIVDESIEQGDHRFSFLINPKKSGKTNLICTSRWGNTKVIPVTVTSKYDKVTQFTSSTYSVTVKKSLNMQSYLEMGIGDSISKWKVSKKSIATISKAGKLKAKKTGKVKVTVILKSGKELTCTVKVVKAKSQKVYWTPSGSVYHKSKSCPTLARSKKIKSGTIKKSKKKRCCKVCG